MSRLDKFKFPGDDRARLMVAAEFLDEEAKARSRENDPKAKVLFDARDVLNEQIRETLPPGDDEE
jgi:hypothetical protein